jgi:hypothetical protein
MLRRARGKPVEPRNKYPGDVGAGLSFSPAKASALGPLDVLLSARVERFLRKLGFSRPRF